MDRLRRINTFVPRAPEPQLPSLRIRTGNWELGTGNWELGHWVTGPLTGIFLLVFFTFGIFNLTGCAGLKEGVKEVAGVSTRALEEGRGQAINRTFNYDFFSCYTQTEDILKKLGVYIYAKDLKKQMIAVYVSESDTTPVGLFFKEVERNITRVEVSSPSSYAKEMIAEKLFSKLDKQLAVGEELDKKQ